MKVITAYVVGWTLRQLFYGMDWARWRVLCPAFLAIEKWGGIGRSDTLATPDDYPWGGTD